MADRDPADQPPDRAPRGVGRRAVLGGALGAAAAGIVGYEVGSAGAAPEDTGARSAASAPEASAVAVVPEGELIADDVQTALVDVYDRTSALARLHDLRVAHELVDDFAPSADGGRLGSLGWTPVVSGAGASAEQAPQEGGVVLLSTGATELGRSAIALGLDHLQGAPVFTLQWRLRLETKPDPAQGFVLAFGALASVTADPAGADIGPGMFWVLDPSAGSTWRCRVVSGGTVTDVDSERVANSSFHRFTITSDGDGLARFTLDDAEVASIPVDKTEAGRYGHGLQVRKTSGTSPVDVALDWFYLRRELPR